MDLDETEKLFPGVKDKIAAPKKQSAFAKEKQAAEAKKREDDAANAAALRSFEESFAAEDEEYTEQYGERDRGPHAGQRGFDNGHRRRDGWIQGPRNGLGSLGSAPGFQQPPSIKRKRALDEMRDLEAARHEEGIYDRRGTNIRNQDTARDHRRDEHESFVPRPTIHLSSLPPSITAEQLKAILSPLLNVQSVRFQPAARPQEDRKKALSAVATLSPDTTAKQIDDAVGQLRDRYVGCGFHMTASRIAPNANLHHNANGAEREQPFGAQRIQQRVPLRAAPPPREYGRYAPPESYEQPKSMLRENEVNIDKLLDLTTIRAVHTIADRLLCEEDHVQALEVEALLMSLPEVQNDERFSFLYDSKSIAGLYYRYCLWSAGDEDLIASDRIFEDVYTRWRAPTKRMPYPRLTDLSYAVQDVDYVSSDEESDDDQPKGPGHAPEVSEEGSKISITPLQRARLTYLLARLPTSNTRLRRGDVARVTNFAIRHAADGIEEIVDMLLLNVDKPFSMSSAAKYGLDETTTSDRDESDENDYDPERPPILGEKAHDAGAISKLDDNKDVELSNAKMVALYIISDILGAIGSAEGVKNAWKYRQLIETGLKHQKTFERLGLLDRELGWGKMKAEQWKRRIAALLDIWEKSSSFGTDVVQSLKAAFNQEAESESSSMIKDERRDDPVDKMPKWMKSFKRVDQESAAPADKTQEAEKTAGGIKLLDQDAYVKPKMIEKPSAENAVSSDLAAESVPRPCTPVETAAQAEEKQEMSSSDVLKPSSSTAPKKRMRAEDMFADSDED